jgi:hypothetical protein
VFNKSEKCVRQNPKSTWRREREETAKRSIARINISAF